MLCVVIVVEILIAVVHINNNQYRQGAVERRKLRLSNLMQFKKEDCLATYYNTIRQEWIDRGYKNTMPILYLKSDKIITPSWLGNEKFHSSHRSNLLRKDFEMQTMIETGIYGISGGFATANIVESDDENEEDNEWLNIELRWGIQSDCTNNTHIENWKLNRKTLKFSED